MSDDQLVFNGIDGDTGSYDLPPMSPEELMQVIRGQTTPENIAELRMRVQRANAGFLGVKEGIAAEKLEEAGWGIIFPQYPAGDERNKQVDAIREALQPLLQLRAGQVSDRLGDWTQGKNKGFRVGADTKGAYLARFGMGPGPADPDKVPYYLLIAGSPSEIPYRFQSQLDVQYAVGRIHFDTLDEYAAYAANVVAAETSPNRLARQAAFFSAANKGDKSSTLSASDLARPLADKIKTAYADWGLQTYIGDSATKATLGTLLGGDQTPSLLFTTSHGMKFGKGSPRQLPHQGALLCGDWPGPDEWKAAIPQDFYFAGDDLKSGADLLGLVAFFFACYGGGTPQYNEFTQYDAPGAQQAVRTDIAPFPFLARLPVQMLGRSRGALAVVGHVERAWTYSFKWPKAGSQTTVFESALERLLKGYPIGYALEFFNERYAELSVELSDALEEISFGRIYDAADMVGTWTANNDARGYAIIGDPAVRLAVVRQGEQPVERAAIVVTPIAPKPATEPTGVPAPATVETAPVQAEKVELAGSLTVETPTASKEVRTYVSQDMANPTLGDLKIVTRRKADGSLETIVAADVVGNEGLLSVHKAAIDALDR